MKEGERGLITGRECMVDNREGMKQSLCTEQFTM